MFDKALRQGVNNSSRLGLSVDFAVYAFILLMGTFQLTHYPHSADFMGDAAYPDLARSLLEQGSYQTSLHPQTTLPPGLPFLLVPVGRNFGFTPASLFPMIAMFTALALIVSYEFLRRIEGRGVAAAACLLLASSPVFFGNNTAIIFPEMPYFFFSMLVLLLALPLDRMEPKRASLGRILLLSIALVLAMLIRSVCIALLVGLIAWCGASFLAARELGMRRAKMLSIPLALGIAAQVAWSVWAHRHENLEWKLPGYPQSYLSQLMVKNGHHPELGLASIRDIPGRVERNIITRTIGFDELLTRRYVSQFWSSPAIFGVAALAGLGLAASLQGGGQLHDWYFLWEEAIFLVWPWDYRDRFLFPVFPLACLYVWRGGKVVKDYLAREPIKGALGLAFVGSLLCFCSAAFALGFARFPTAEDHVRGDHLQPIAATLFWGLLAITGFVLLKLHRKNRGIPFGHIPEFLIPRFSISCRLVGALVVAILVVSGTKTTLAVGRYNLHPDVTKQPLYPEMQATEWIRTNEPSNRVIMAREPDFVYHFTGRRVVWFPPISDPKVLMDGIRRHHVEVLVVTRHPKSYWLPPEETCFELLQRAYPAAFHLVDSGADYRVFEVVSSTGGI